MVVNYTVRPFEEIESKEMMAAGVSSTAYVC